MPKTIVEKILESHTKGAVEPGNFLWCDVDLAFGNDITAPIAIQKFDELGKGEVFDTDKIALIPDHFIPSKDRPSARNLKTLKDFADRYGIKHFYKTGCMGVEHALLPEKGLILPAQLVVGADSHTCTHAALGAFATGVGSTDLGVAFALGKCWIKAPDVWRFTYEGNLPEWTGGKDIILFTIGQIGQDGATYKAMLFDGPAIRSLPMDDRFTISNMAIEAGAKTGIIEPDETTTDYLKNYAGVDIDKERAFSFASDPGAVFQKTFNYDLTELEPQVAFPHSPANAKPVSEASGIEVDQVVIGSCTNGRISDLRLAAKVLKGKKVSSSLRLIILPATQRVYLEAIREGLIEIFIEAGATVTTPSCGPCLGGHMGVLGPGEKALATTNRNFIGRMGDVTSEVYLSNPAVAAATAISGRIEHPGNI